MKVKRAMPLPRKAASLLAVMLLASVAVSALIVARGEEQEEGCPGGWQGQVGILRPAGCV
jgi:hypothetical protein